MRMRLKEKGTKCWKRLYKFISQVTKLFSTVVTGSGGKSGKRESEAGSAILISSAESLTGLTLLELEAGTGDRRPNRWS